MSIVERGVSLPAVQTRKEFIDCLENMINQSLLDGEEHSRGRPRELKTYIIESNGGFPTRFKSNRVSCDISNTGLDKIKILHILHAGNTLDFFLDTSDPRFFILHTNEKSDDVNKTIDALTDDDNHTFDNTWFYSALLKRLSEELGNSFKGFGVSYTNNTFSSESNIDSDIEDLSLSINGSMAVNLQKMIEREPRVDRIIAYNTVRISRGQPPSFIQDDVHNNGYFAVKRGKSIQDHLRLVDLCKEEYAKIVRKIEDARIGVKNTGDKTVVSGNSFDFEFKNEIEDVEFFISRMFSSAKPFRLWGLKSKIEKDYYKVTAVDLHAGGLLHFDIAKDMIRVGIYGNTCGNTILRLFTNLQIHFDSKIVCKQLCD